MIRTKVIAITLLFANASLSAQRLDPLFDYPHCSIENTFIKKQCLDFEEIQVPPSLKSDFSTKKILPKIKLEPFSLSQSFSLDEIKVPFHVLNAKEIDLVEPKKVQPLVFEEKPKPRSPKAVYEKVYFKADQDLEDIDPIEGQKEVIIEGPYQVSFNHKHTYQGKTYLKEGHLSLNGAVLDIEVDDLSLLSGNGTLRNLHNKGKVRPGNSIGTLIITGHYNQDPIGTLEIEVNPNESDRLIISQNAFLDGKLILSPSGGLYEKGLRYRFISAQNVTGTFNSIQSAYPDLFEVFYGSNYVELSTVLKAFVIPVSISDLLGNSRRMGEYLFGDAFTPINPSLENALDVLSSLSPGLFREGLMKVSPIVYGSLTRLNLQNDTRFANLFSHQIHNICRCAYDNKRLREVKRNFFKKFLEKRRIKKRHKLHLNQEKVAGVWLEPLGFYYKQNNYNGSFSNEGQPGFNAYTFGVAGGYSHAFKDQLMIGLASAYSHSNLIWESGLGLANENSVYLSPYIGYYAPSFYLNALYLSSFNFYQVDRNIHYGTYKTKANARQNYYDLGVKVEGGKSFNIQRGWDLEPTCELMYLYMMGTSFKESDAGVLNLNVKRRRASYLQPSLRVHLQKNFIVKRGCLMPKVYLGWLANIPLGEKQITAQFFVEPTNRQRVGIVVDPMTTNQLILGFNVPFQSFRHFYVSGGYEANFLSLYQIHQVNVRLQWDF